MDERRARAWRAMEMGPAWRRRARSPAAEVTPAPRAEPGGGAPAGTAAALDWDRLRVAVRDCTRCALSESRTQTVFGVGPRRAGWMLIGEAPGAEEDARGEPFVGPAGQLLDRMLAALGLSRQADVFIANVLKCRPPRNRDPRPEEVAACEPYLLRQIALVSPRVLVVLGRFAAQSLLQTEASIATLRGRVHRRASDAGDVPVIVTYHPAYLLRNPADKGKAWNDLCLARRVYRERDGD